MHVMIPLPPITVFDTETTGLDPKKGNRIIEIAGLRIENGILDEEKVFVSLVNPERDIPWEARQVNKIKEEDVKNAPSIEEVLPSFLQFAEGSILVAHNAGFDMSFLENEKQFCWGYIDLPDCLCTMRLSQAIFPNQFGHSLDAVAKRLNLTIPHKERHRALPDVVLTAQALLKMINMVDISSFDEIMAVASIKTKVS